MPISAAGGGAGSAFALLGGLRGFAGFVAAGGAFALPCALASIFAQLSLRPTVRFQTGLPGVLSGSTQK